MTAVQLKCETGALATFPRSQAAILGRRLRETRRFIQAVVGPRQVGKTTLVQHVIEVTRMPARLHSGCIDRDDDCARRTAALSCRQARDVAAAVRAWLQVFRADSLLHKNAWTTARCG